MADRSTESDRMPHWIRPLALRLRWLPAGPLGLAALVALGDATEVVFQPDVFAQFTPAAIAQAMSWQFFECFTVGCTIVAAVALIERRAPRRAWLYTLELVLGIGAASVVGIAVWGAVVFGQDVVHTVPYLAGKAVSFALIGVFLALVDGFRKRVRRATALNRELQTAQAALEAQTELTTLRLLEAQIEPHFLFNTIATLRRTWRVDPVLGERMHANVMRYLAATLPQMRSPVGTLGEEIELARAYLELFALRMGDRLRFSISLPAELAPLSFPRMVVLTLVENAIKHGLAPADDGGSIAVSARIEDRQLLVSVVDDGVGFGVADTGGTGIGLVNIRARLLTQYGRGARLGLGAGAQGGVEAVVRLPLEADGASDRTMSAPRPRSRPEPAAPMQSACMVPA